MDTDVDGPNTVGQHPSDHLSTSGQDENRMAHGKAMQNGTGHQSAELFESKSAYVRKTRTESTESKDNEGFDRDIPENPGERSGNSRGPNTNLSNGMERTAIHSIVLECTGWGYIDVTALKSLVEVWHNATFKLKVNLRYSGQYIK